MIKIFYDFETTHLNVHSAEIITAYFHVDESLNAGFKVRPSSWFKDAEKIHGISRLEAMSFTPKLEGLTNIINFMKENKGEYICFANEKNFGSTYQYDYAVLKDEMRRLQTQTGKRYYYRFLELFENEDYKFSSAHTLAKEKLSLKKNKLEDLCKYFNFEYKDAHDAKNDVMLLMKVYRELQRL